MKTIGIIFCILFSTANAFAHSVACSNVAGMDLQLYTLDKVDTKNGVTTSTYVINARTQDGKPAARYTVVAEESNSKVVFTRTSNEKLYGYDANQVIVEKKTFDLMPGGGCAPNAYSEQTYAGFGKEKVKYADLNLTPLDCDVIKNNLMTCSDNVQVPARIFKVTGDSQVTRTDLLGLWSRCASNNLENGGGIVFTGGLRSLIPEKYRVQTPETGAVQSKSGNLNQQP
jgi:hypothetical protein